MIPTEPAERHREIAARFGDVARGVVDWLAPTPVPEWAALDVVQHLVDWSTGFLAAGGIELPANPATEFVERWEAHAAAIQALLDGAAADEEFRHPVAGTHQLGEAIDRFYTSDVFMHTWDLARASGQPVELDADEAQRLLDAMLPIEEMLRASGQFGQAVPVADDAPASHRLMAFIGRRV